MMMHEGLTQERWSKFSLLEQLANIGTEIGRTINWKRKNDKEKSLAAFYRALELIDLTIADPKNKKRLKEIVRTRFVLVDHFMYDNEYNTTDEIWENYFYQYNYAAALQRGR